MKGKYLLTSNNEQQTRTSPMSESGRGDVYILFLNIGLTPARSLTFTKQYKCL
ncbi:MAG: hypothetical protein WCY27_03015 [archaeon]